MRTPIALLAVVLAFGCSSKDSAAKKMEDKQKALDAAKAAKDKVLAEKDAARWGKGTPTEPPPKLDAPYDDSGNTLLKADLDCPGPFWALFSGDAPGGTPEEKKANAAKRGELAKTVTEKTYLVKFRAPTDMKLSAYDAPKGKFTITLPGTIDCTDSIGRIAIAWTKAEAKDPGASAAKEGQEVNPNIWVAQPIAFDAPVATMAEAKEFENKMRLSLSARVVLKLGKTEVDKKMKKIAKVTEKAMGETISMGGGVEDWGAGRLIHAELVGVRVATDREKTQLFEKKGN